MLRQDQAQYAMDPLEFRYSRYSSAMEDDQRQNVCIPDPLWWARRHRYLYVAGRENDDFVVVDRHRTPKDDHDASIGRRQQQDKDDDYDHHHHHHHGGDDLKGGYWMGVEGLTRDDQWRLEEDARDTG